MSNTIKLIKNFTSLSIVQVVNFIFPLITIPYVSRIIGPEGYGIINYSTAFVGYFTIVIAYGFDLTATRRIAKLKEDNISEINNIISQVITSRILLFIFSSVVFFISLYLVPSIFQNNLVSLILFLGCISNVISPQFVFQGLQSLRIYAKISFVRGILNTLLIFLLVKQSEDYIIIASLTSFFAIGVNFFLILYAFRKFNLRYTFISLKSSIKFIYNDRIVFFSTVVISLYTSTNIFILGFFVNITEVGFYTTSHNFLNIVNAVLAMPLSSALFPYISKAFSISKTEGINTVQKITPVVFYLTLTASIGLFFLAPFLVKIIYGVEFLNAIISLRIISFLPFIIGMSNLLGIQLMLNLGMDKLFLYTTSIASFLGILLSVIMSKNYGYIGAAWNCLIIEIFVTLLMYFIMKSKGVDIIKFESFKIQNILKIFKNMK